MRPLTSKTIDSRSVNSRHGLDIKGTWLSMPAEKSGPSSGCGTNYKSITPLEKGLRAFAK